MSSSLTLLDLAKINGHDKTTGIIEAVGSAAPEVTTLPSRTIKGTSYDVLLCTSYPAVGFRNANQGVNATKATFQTKKVQCHILDIRVEVDKALADSYEDGAESLLAMQAALAGKSALLGIGAQTFYGVDEDAAGFPGLRSMVASTMVLDATGSSSNAATSVYLVFAGQQGVQYVYGNGSTFELQPFVDGEGEDSDGKKFPAYVSYLKCRAGLQSGTPFGVARICNLTTQTGKGLTDTLLAQALEKFPIDTQPTHIIMNRQSRGQLQRARTITMQGDGKRGSVGSQEGNVAPIPTEAFGIPIITTDSLVNTEAIVA
jgi:hypothetical protein